MNKLPPVVTFQQVENTVERTQEILDEMFDILFENLLQEEKGIEKRGVSAAYGMSIAQG